METEVTNGPITDLSSFLYLIKKSTNIRPISAENFFSVFVITKYNLECKKIIFILYISGYPILHIYIGIILLTSKTFISSALQAKPIMIKVIIPSHETTSHGRRNIFTTKTVYYLEVRTSQNCNS